MLRTACLAKASPAQARDLSRTPFARAATSPGLTVRPAVLTSPQAISYVVAPSLLMSLTVSELRTLPPVQHAILGKVFSEVRRTQA